MGSASDFAETYARPADTYDRTRSAALETLLPLIQRLRHVRAGAAPLDVGGGTGNCAKALQTHGYDVAVVDRSPAMLSVCAGKDLPVVRGDAAALPAQDSSVDVVTMISMLHQVPDWRGGLAEADRVLKPVGTLALLLYTAEHLLNHYFLGYFPRSRTWAGTEHVELAAYIAELPGAHVQPLQIRTTDDLTGQVMRRHPWLGAAD